MAKQRKPPKVTVNLAAIELAYAPSTPELLENGTAREVRQALGWIADLITMGEKINPKTMAILGTALSQIARGADANKALGLNRKKKYGAWYSKQFEWLIKDLMKQGMTRKEAEVLMGRLDLSKLDDDPDGFTLDDDPDARADARLQKRLLRAKTK